MWSSLWNREFQGQRYCQNSQCFQGFSAFSEIAERKAVICTRNWRDTTFATPRKKYKNNNKRSTLARYLRHRRIVVLYRLRKSAALTTPGSRRFRIEKTTLSCFILATFATPQLIKNYWILLWSVMWSTPFFDRFCVVVKLLKTQWFQDFLGGFASKNNTRLFCSCYLSYALKMFIYMFGFSKRMLLYHIFLRLSIIWNKII